MPGAHLEPELVARYASGLLEPAERAEAERHIDLCSTCRELVAAVVRAFSASSANLNTRPGVAADVLPKGTKVGAYELERPIGAGGMGVVYLATDERLRRKVALKCVRERRGDHSQLLNEARLMAQLAHPNVVPVYDVVESEGLLFIAMELVPGRTLRLVLEGGARRWEEVVDLLLDAGAGLAAAHEAGIVHGDVKPGNVLVGDDGRARVTDFGLASMHGDSSGALRGTEAYLAPEQRTGQACDARADQYAFGVMMHETLLGALPGVAAKRSVPSRVKRVIERALSSEPGKRYPSMRALLAELRSARLGRGRFIAAGAVAVVAFTLFSFAVGGRRAAAAQCEAAAAELSSPWTSEARAATREAFLRVPSPAAKETLERVEALVDAWAKDFDEARTAACSAPLFARGPQANQARQLECLSDQVLEAKALTAQLLDADVGVVLHAVAMAERLPNPSSCLSSRSDAPKVVRSDAARVVNGLIAKTRSTAAAGRYKDAMAPALEAAKAADDSGDERLRAMAQTVLGGIQGLNGEHAKASQTLLEAVRLAERSGEDRAAALAWSDIVQMEYLRAHHDAVIQWAPAALGACERVDDVRLKTEVMGTLGASLSEKGRNDEAKALLDEAVALRVAAYGERDRRTAAMLSVLANTLAMAGALDGAIDAHRRALAAAEVAFGRSHPEVAVIRQNLGDDYLYGLRAKEAIDLLAAAEHDLAAAFGEKSRSVAICTTDLGLAQLLDERPADALATFERAVAMWKEVAPQHPTLGAALLGRYQAKRALGQPADASELEVAEKLAQELPPFEHGRVALEWALTMSDVAKAKALVTTARGELDSTTLPLIAKEKARADAWLASH